MPTETEPRPFRYHFGTRSSYFVLYLLANDPMPLKAESTYPSRRTYVVKLRSDASSHALTGRLENLVTGGQRDFASGDELLQSIESDLNASNPDNADPAGKKT